MTRKTFIGVVCAGAGIGATTAAAGEIPATAQEAEPFLVFISFDGIQGRYVTKILELSARFPRSDLMMSIQDFRTLQNSLSGLASSESAVPCTYHAGMVEESEVKDTWIAKAYRKFVPDTRKRQCHMGRAFGLDWVLETRVSRKASV